MKRALWSVGLIALVLLAVGCGGGGGGTPIIGGTPGNVNVYATDAPAPGLDAIWVQIARVDARSADGAWAPLLSFNPPVELNILDLSTVRQFLGSARLPAGTYDRIRVTLAGARVVQNGTSTTVNLTTNVIEIPATLTVNTTGGVELVIDFQGSQGLVSQDAGGFYFDHSKVGVVINPIHPGNPPPPDPTDPGHRAVLVKGKILTIDSNSQSFTLEVHHSRLSGGGMPQSESLPILTIFTNPQTQFNPPGKTFGDLTVGAELGVVGMPQSSGIQALNVTIEDIQIEPNSIYGAVLEVLYDLKMIKLGLGDPDPCLRNVPCVMASGAGAGSASTGASYPIPWNFTWVAYTAGTTFKSPTGDPLSPADVTPGKFLEVTGSWQSDFFVASSITVFDSPPGPNEISGAILSIDATHRQLQVGFPMGFGEGGSGNSGGGTGPGGPMPPIQSITVQVSHSTVIIKRDGTALTFNDLQVGMLIHAVGTFDTNNVFQATKIVVVEFEPPQDRVAGQITALRPEVTEFDIGGGAVIMGGPGTAIFPPPPTPPVTTVKVTPDTKIQDSNGNELTFADLQIGDFITAEGKYDPNRENYFIAGAVWVYRNPPQPGHVEGTVQSRDDAARILEIVPPFADRWAGPTDPIIRVHAGESTRIVDANGGPLAFEQIQINDFVGADGQFNSDGIFEADTIMVMGTPPPPPPPGERICGEITAIQPDSHSFDLGSEGRTTHVLVTEQTQIIINGQPGQFSDLQVGQHACVIGGPDTSSNGTIVAHLVIVGEWPPPPPPGIGVCGEIAAVNPDTHSFDLASPDGSWHILVTPETQIIINGQPGQFSDLHPGQHACVHGLPDPQHDRTLIAGLVIVNPPPPPPPPIRICGPIVAIYSDTHVFDLGMPDGPVHIIVTPETRIIINGQPGQFNDLKVGQPACVEGTPDPNHPRHVIAAVVVSPPPPPPPPRVLVCGVIIGVNPDNHTFVLGNENQDSITVVVTPETKIIVDGRPGTFDDLQPGRHACVEGMPDPNHDHTLIAHIVYIGEIPPPPPPRVGVCGEITAIHPDDHSFDLGTQNGSAVRIIVTPHTKIFINGRPGGFGDLQVGQHACVEGHPAPDHPDTIIAFVVVVGQPPPPPPPPGIRICGEIVGINGDAHSFDLGTEGRVVHVVVTPDTKIFINGQPGQFSDLKVGQHACTEGRPDPQHDATIIAFWVAVGEPPPPPPPPPPHPNLLMGSIAGIDADGHKFLLHLYVPPGVGAEPPPIHVLVNNETRIEDRFGNPLGFSDLAVGQFVVVKGEWVPTDVFPPQFLAHRIVVVHDHPDEVVMPGKIVSIDSTNHSFVMATPGDHPVTVLVVDRTAIRDSDGTLKQFSDLSVGQFVLVFGDRNTANPVDTLTADLIVLHDFDHFPGGGP